MRNRIRIGRVLGINLYVDWGLFLFGGVANIEREPETPAAELSIALVGPATSAVLGFLFLVVAGLIAARTVGGETDPAMVLARLGPLATLLAWLGPVNLILAVFNLIPAFPLDGGRVFRAIAWAISGSLQKATWLAATMGQGFGWLLIGSRYRWSMMVACSA